jgi:hypothetical protein
VEGDKGEEGGKKIDSSLFHDASISENLDLKRLSNKP